MPFGGGLIKLIWGMPHISFFGELDWRYAAMGGMWPVVVIVMLPCRQHGSGVRQRREQRLIQAFVTQASVEAFDEGVLCRLAWRDVMPVDPAVL